MWVWEWLFFVYTRSERDVVRGCGCGCGVIFESVFKLVNTCLIAMVYDKD